MIVEHIITALTTLLLTLITFISGAIYKRVKTMDKKASFSVKQSIAIQRAICSLNGEWKDLSKEFQTKYEYEMKHLKDIDKEINDETD